MQFGQQQKYQHNDWKKLMQLQLCLIFMRTIARKRLVLFYWYDVKALNLRMNQMSKVYFFCPFINLKSTFYPLIFKTALKHLGME